MKFVKYLKEQKPGKRLAIFWEGASYHNSQEFREYLMLINQEKPEQKWLINCLKFAPNAPQKKPVEDICCLLYTSPSPRDRTRSRMPSSA